MTVPTPSDSALPGIRSPRAHRRRLPWILGSVASLLVLAGLGFWGWWRHTYPYGYSHSCAKILGISLRLFADDYQGWLPYGQATPEASLSLLAKDDKGVQWVLRGKHLPQATVDEALRRDGVLGPDSCGWHYVEGLREGDDPRLAVLWDKVTGLGHNGDRVRGTLHEVVFLDGSERFIMREGWPAFMAEQKQLLAEVMAQRTKADPPIRWSDEAALGPNVSRPRRTAMVPVSGTQTNTPKVTP